MTVIHFFKTTGKIRQMTTGTPAVFLDEDDDYIEVAGGVSPEWVTTHLIDLKTRKVVEKSEDQKRAEQAPSVAAQTVRTIKFELAATDQFMMPDRPLTDGERKAWRAYRQALRDLSKLPAPADQITAWPTRPDGSDPITHLRQRSAS